MSSLKEVGDLLEHSQKLDEAMVGETHRHKIARKTLKMPDAMVNVMGGMTKAEARKVLGETTIVLDGGGELYCAECTRRNTVAPAFTNSEDVELWKSLYGKRFKKIIIVVKDE